MTSIPTMVESSHAVGRASQRSWLTVERAAYGLITLVGVGLRLVRLDLWPLSPQEAAQALPAWAAASGQPLDLTGASPLLYGLQRLLFQPFGSHDNLARWWPAVLGGLAVLLFWAFRDRLSRGGALMASLLWAISPMAVFTSRLGLGYGLVPPLALAVLAGVAWAFPSRTPVTAPGQVARDLRRDGAATSGRLERGLLFSAVALGLLLASGAGAYTAVLVGAAGALVWRSSLVFLWDALRVRWKGLFLAGGLAFAVGATFVFTAPAGLAAAVGLFGAWLRNLRPGAGEYTAWGIPGRLLLSDVLITGFAVAGAVISLRRRDRFGMFAGLAAVLALLVAVIGSGRHPADLGLVILSACLLAGPTIAQVLRAVWLEWRGADPWLLVGLSLVLLASAAICLPSAFNPSNNESWRRLYAGVGVATVVMFVLIWLVYGIWGNPRGDSGPWRAVTQGLAVVLLVIGTAWTLGQLSANNYDRGAWRRAAVVNQTPASGIADLQKELRDLSALHSRGAGEAPIDVVMPMTADDSLIPFLRWQLRAFPNVRFAASMPAPSAAPIVITEAKAPDGSPQEQPATLAPALRSGASAGVSDRYGGAEFTLLERWTPSSLSDFYSRLRWVLYREVLTPADGRSVVLWVERPEPGSGQ